MSLASFALGLGKLYGPRASGFQKRIWKLVAFLARYGHQPADVSLSMPVDRLRRLADAVGDLLDRENEASRPGKD